MEKDQLINSLYKKLEVAYREQNYNEMIDILKFLAKLPFRRNDFIFQCLYIIIKNNYCIEVRQIVDEMIIFKKDKLKVDLLWKAIKNQEKYFLLTDEQKEVYHNAISYGRFYYKMQDLFTAYDIYSWGYYITEQPIFLYYIGKMLYKNKNYYEAEKCLKEYVKVGDSKVDKAYLYLYAIKKRNHQFFNANQCSIHCLEVNKVYGKDYELEEIYFEDEDTDILKIRLQNKELLRKRKQ